MVLQKLQSTYQGQLTHYKEQEADTVRIIKQLKEERQDAEMKSQMGMDRIQRILRGWLNQTKRLIDESSMRWWTKWAQNTAELQLLRADVENRRKEGDDCYTLTSEDFTAIRDELAEDFQALADEQLVQVRHLVAQLDDDRLDAQIQFESYERSRLREDKAREAVTVNLSDEEPSPVQGTAEDQAGVSQAEGATTETPVPEQQPEPPAQPPQSEQPPTDQPQTQPQQKQQVSDEPLETLE